MPQIFCNACSVPFDLPASYVNYSGQIRCPSCSRIHIIEIRSGNVQKNELIPIVDYHVREPVKITGAPDPINSGLDEAQLCNDVNANKACVVMCRRVVEQVCDHKGAKGINLYSKINDLQNSGFISENESKLFNEIRFFGNYGAHPSEDLLGDVEKDDSDLVLEITLHLVRHVYEVPEKIKTLEERRRGI